MIPYGRANDMNKNLIQYAHEIVGQKHPDEKLLAMAVYIISTVNEDEHTPLTMEYVKPWGYVGYSGDVAIGYLTVEIDDLTKWYYRGTPIPPPRTVGEFWKLCDILHISRNRRPNEGLK